MFGSSEKPTSRKASDRLIVVVLSWKFCEWWGDGKKLSGFGWLSEDPNSDQWWSSRSYREGEESQRVKWIVLEITCIIITFKGYYFSDNLEVYKFLKTIIWYLILFANISQRAQKEKASEESSLVLSVPSHKNGSPPRGLLPAEAMRIPKEGKHFVRELSGAISRGITTTRILNSFTRRHKIYPMQNHTSKVKSHYRKVQIAIESLVCDDYQQMWLPTNYSPYCEWGPPTGYPQL